MKIGQELPFPSAFPENIYADYPYCIEFGYQGQAVRQQNIDWLTQTFGSNDSWCAGLYSGSYYFKREKDLTWFRLWKGN